MRYRISYFFKIIIVVAIAVFFTACSHGHLLIEGERGGMSVEARQERGRDYRQAAGRIPPGHMPPPGSCRIWYPNTPPGQQPPPGDCYTLSRQVPPGAWLIKG